jgi:hypothetical protein
MLLRDVEFGDVEAYERMRCDPVMMMAAVRALLHRARDEDRWGAVHAFPGISNAASNGIRRSLRFTLLEDRDVTFADRVLRTTLLGTADLAVSS